MKTVKLILEVECKDSTRISDLVSDLEDELLCDNVKEVTIVHTEDDKPLVDKFENPDFEED